jgi:subtilisin family serine protease
MVGIRPLFLAILMLAAIPVSAAANTDTRIIVKREPGLTGAERADIRADADVRYVESLPLPRTEVVTAAPGDVRDALRDLNADPDVAYAERDRVRTAAVPDDDHYNTLWSVPLIGADAAWLLQDTTPDFVTGVGQVVAVVDSGIDSTHPDLVNQIDSTVNFLDGEDPTDAGDGDGHGTHVSGTIAAERDNGEGIAGIAPGAKVMALRALDDNGLGYDSDIADAFAYAGANGVKVVNASLGGDEPSQTLRTAIHNASNTLFVVAAGNDGDDNDTTPTYPCNTPEPNVLCVGATDEDDDVASFSNYGARAVDVFAPGLWIASTVPVALAGPGFDLDSIDFGSEPYDYMHGTSMAAPHVSAVAALVRQVNPALGPHALKEIILSSAATGLEYDPISVSGARLQADAAVQLAIAGTGLADGDGDGWADPADACPTEPHNTSDGCYLDDDWDRAPDGTDNCLGVPNTNQGDIDSDGDGDACDTDKDGDGIPNSSDFCGTTPGVPVYRGCPPPAPPVTPPTQNPPADADRDGVADASDACPKEGADTLNGCPLAQVASLSAKAERRSATVKIAATRLATMRITVERKKGRRWVRVARKTVGGSRATLKLSRLKRGKHRVRISISSSAGRGNSVSKTFRVR